MPSAVAPDNRRTGVAVAMIDPAAHLVTFGDGTVAYDKLLLATGASARRIDNPGAGPGQRPLPANPG
jgi:NADPH-dependent 2,4-dienoyl-CoA reductase/sulfur reductase-like enzyme